MGNVQLSIVICCLSILFLPGCAEGERFDDGKLKGRVKDGKRIGVWEGYYFSGERKFKGKYSEGKAVGEWTWWYDGGGKKEVSFWLDSVRSGDFTSFHENGQIKEEGKFFKDMKVADWTWYYDDGQLEGEGSFVNGKRVGEFITWHRKGKGEDPTVASRYVWGDSTGTVVSYHSNGLTAYEGQFVRDKQDGIWKFYDEEGSLYSEQIYRNGVKVGGD